MKLLSKTSRYYLTFLAIASIFSIALLYFAIQYMVYEDVDKKLMYESNRILFYLEDNGAVPESNYIYRIDTVSRIFNVEGLFSDTLIYEAYDEEYIPYRQYQFVAPAGGNLQYRITLRGNLLDNDDLVVALFISISIIFLLLLIGLFWINQKVARQVWSPFFKNLQKLSAFKLDEKMPVHLESSGIVEFDQLNEVISGLISQIEKDFLTLKEFNENISHEMQTPLAVISNKMELLMESPDLTEQEFRLLKAAYKEVNKLSRISRALVLISKIENKEFSELEPVFLGKLLNEIVDQLDEMLQIKQLSLTKSVEADPKRKVDPMLLNILFTNLIKNAIQHNQEGGIIRIRLGEDFLEIINSGTPNRMDTDRLFQRFYRGDARSASMGLGLAIVQKICTLYDFQLSYHYQEKCHWFKLSF